MDHPELIGAVSAVTWGSICFAHGLARRSWFDCLLFGFLLTLLLLVVYAVFRHFEWPTVGAWLAVFVQGAFLVLFWYSVTTSAWRKARSREVGPHK